ncbi:MAG: PAS domain-containing sensor histidine kinase [Ruminococcaceae bacterium]|nr:PAS domain-containing sensor histidine kinase [Oscillospiraceae bacterium]
MNIGKRKFTKWLRSTFPISLRDIGISVGLLACGFAVCFGLQPISETDFHVPLIFVLVVLLISLLTDGFFFGLVASVLSVVAVNYAFTFPYFHFNFYLTGYPITFFCMFIVSVITCTLTSRARKSEQMRMEAEKEKMRANLLRAISHDLRTPLTSIVGTLAALEDETLLSALDRKRLLEDARSEAEWLINMMENLLSITRIGGNEAPKIHTEAQALEELMGEALSRFRKQYPAMKVKTSIPDELIMSKVDAMLIEQVIINLLVNVALHAKGADMINLILSREGEMACISVEDNGAGINRKAIANLLEGRVQGPADDRKGDSRRTMGIGLSVCQTIVKAHGGTMKAENRDGGGAIVSFTLPITETEEDENADTLQDFDY